MLAPGLNTSIKRYLQSGLKNKTKLYTVYKTKQKHIDTPCLQYKDISRLKIKEKKEMYCLNTNQEKKNTNQEKAGVARLISQSGLQSKKNYKE